LEEVASFFEEKRFLRDVPAPPIVEV